jgi:hypothetical protein
MTTLTQAAPLTLTVIERPWHKPGNIRSRWGVPEYAVKMPIDKIAGITGAELAAAKHCRHCGSTGAAYVPYTWYDKLGLLEGSIEIAVCRQCGKETEI